MFKTRIIIALVVILIMAFVIFVDKIEIGKLGNKKQKTFKLPKIFIADGQIAILLFRVGIFITYGSAQ